jgi:hypothetical protein
MRVDVYTKVILTVIALALLAIACNSVVRPTTVSADSALSGVEFLAIGPGFMAIDTRSGDIWEYPYEPGNPTHMGKITRLGQPLTKQ